MTALVVPAVMLHQAPDLGPVMLGLADGWSGVAGPAASIASSGVSLVCAMIGVAWVRRRRLEAYRWLERSVLVSIFFVQVLAFWQDELAAIGQLGWNLILLGALRFAIREEEAKRRREAALT
jgi:hypothetical protein